MEGKTMRAIQYNGYSGGASALKHVEIPVPSPKNGEVLLKLEATALNPIDWKMQKGMMRPFLPPKFPYVPAHDVAGEVVEVGPGVNNFKAGDKVISMLSFPQGGGLAEYAVVSADFTEHRPLELSPSEGAGLASAGLTALQALNMAGINFNGTDKPANFLITASSGGVGHFAVQLAKLANIHVTATCGSHNIELVKSLGADEVLDYKTPEGESLKSPSGKKYDAVINCAAGVTWSTLEPNLDPEGKVIDMNPSLKMMISSFVKKMTFSKKKLVAFMLSPKVEDFKFLAGLVREGKLKIVIDSKHSLSNVQDAWAKSMSGHATGKIIVEM